MKHLTKITQYGLAILLLAVAFPFSGDSCQPRALRTRAKPSKLARTEVAADPFKKYDHRSSSRRRALSLCPPQFRNESSNTKLRNWLR